MQHTVLNFLNIFSAVWTLTDSRDFLTYIFSNRTEKRKKKRKRRKMNMRMHVYNFHFDSVLRWIHERKIAYTYFTIINYINDQQQQFFASIEYKMNFLLLCFFFIHVRSLISFVSFVLRSKLFENLYTYCSYTVK